MLKKYFFIFATEIRNKARPGGYPATFKNKNMKTINNKNLEKITHNIHKKIDDITNIFKYRDVLSYRVIQETVGKWHILKVVGTDRAFMTGAFLDQLIALTKKYMKIYSNIFYTIDVHKDYIKGEVYSRVAYCIHIELEK